MQRQRKRRPLHYDDDSDVEIADKGLEQKQELERLERVKIQYRKLCDEKEKYFYDSKALIKKQREELTLLENESTELLLHTNLTESHEHIDVTNFENLEDLSEESDEIMKDISMEKKRHYNLDKRIRSHELQLNAQQLKIGSINAIPGHKVIRSKFMKQKLSTAENRLETCLKYLYGRLAVNAKLKDEVSHLHMVKMNFVSLNSRLTKVLNERWREVEHATITTSQKVDIVSETRLKYRALLNKAVKDKERDEIMRKEVLRDAVKDRSEREFMITNGAKREYDPDMIEWKTKSAAHSLKHRVEMHESLEVYEDVSTKLRDISKLTDFNQIVDQFNDNECSNFAIYNFVACQTQDVQILENEIVEIGARIREIRREKEKFYNEHIAKMIELENRCRVVSQEVEELDGESEAVRKVIYQLMTEIQRISDAISTKSSDMKKTLFKAEHDITTQNVLEHIAAIQMRVNELLNIVMFVEWKTQEDTGEIKEVARQDPAVNVEEMYITPINDVIPCMSDESFQSMFEDDEVPLSRDQLTKFVMLSVVKKEQRLLGGPVRGPKPTKLLFKGENKNK